MVPLIIAALVVIGLAAALVFVPLFRRTAATEVMAATAEATVQELEVRRANLYQALRDLEADYQVGKITEEDYSTLSARYKLQAAEVLRQLSQATNGAGLPGAALDAALEAAIRARRAIPAAVPDDRSAPEPVPAAPAEPARRFCTSCGNVLGAADRFCAHCGTPVPR